MVQFGHTPVALGLALYCNESVLDVLYALQKMDVAAINAAEPMAWISFMGQVGGQYGRLVSPLYACAA